MKRLLTWLFNRECKCAYDPIEVMNLRVDPECVKCGKKLSDFEEEAITY